MRILMVGSEAAPYAKTGGLADVLGSLPAALARLGHQVDVVIPKYRGISFDEAHIGGARVVFVDNPHYFDREFLYSIAGRDYEDNAARFGFLCRGALEWAARTGRQRYDVIHAHDWQTGLVPVMLATMFRNHPTLAGTPTVFTIHNLSYQGLFSPEWLYALGLGRELMRVDALEFWGRISFLKGGILFSRIVTTVSPRYAKEIQAPEFGFGFDGILRSRSGDLVGILNGIDYDQWNPERDVHLPAPFSASYLEGKVVCKRAVLEEYGIPVSQASMGRPLVAMISRMVDQKGLDLVAALADRLPQLNATFCVLGTGERRYEDMWRGLNARHPERIGARIGFEERLAHRVEAGADLFLMPSRFEPCGLNQMYSLHYGTVPLVRATGGLADTVRNFDPHGDGNHNGFTFDAYSPQALFGTLQWALDIYKDKDAWRRLQLAGMRDDNSWDAAARKYVEVYERSRA
jgi:starch synthase